MRVITQQCALKVLDAQREGWAVPETERLLSILFPYFMPRIPTSLGESPCNLRLERSVVEPLLQIASRNPAITDWLDVCQDVPLIYIDLPSNSWMISDSVQVQAIFVDNGIGGSDDFMLFIDEEPRSTVTVLLAPRGKRCKRRLVWAMGTDRFHNELNGGTPDDQAETIPSTLELVATSGLSVPEFCRLVESVIAASLFQRHSLRAAMLPVAHVGGLPRDSVQRAAYMREYDGADRRARNREEVRSLFRIERVGLVPEEVQRRMPIEAVRTGHGPLLCSVWVRGHYRNQKHGPGLGLTKQIWIEPHRKGPEEVSPRHPMSLIGRAP
ncbi:hypothetical protein [Methylobacterium sp. J-090]|uniref:hypothetical protein n=1 Tax=Methylobacterium sp. J-090 TaxID=2836666 RepID=UPI001FBBB750|nr:hypothetical protein [Methylobacterium sp. J-090]MCJ2082434.1 hypothetical protein [Methylobacterium sp. J-090]